MWMWFLRDQESGFNTRSGDVMTFRTHSAGEPLLKEEVRNQIVLGAGAGAGAGAGQEQEQEQERYLRGRGRRARRRWRRLARIASSSVQKALPKPQRRES